MLIVTMRPFLRCKFFIFLANSAQQPNMMMPNMMPPHMMNPYGMPPMMMPQMMMSQMPQMPQMMMPQMPQMMPALPGNRPLFPSAAATSTNNQHPHAQQQKPTFPAYR